MSWRGTVLLAAAVAIALVVAYRDVASDNPGADWSSLLEEPLPTPPSLDIEQLIDVRAKEVRGIQVTHSGRHVAAERTAYGWTNTSTPKVVNDFLDSLAKLAIILHIDADPSESELVSYGLLEPVGRIVLAFDRGTSLTIDLGHHNPSATGIYARLSDPGEIVLTGAVAVWEIEKVIAAIDATGH